jgi:hypothetical protein
VRWVRDASGRIPRRPHFLAEEIDKECEALVSSFLRRRRGRATYPLSTDDLTVLVEQETADLDLYADLSSEGPDTEGVTDFFPGQRPRVRIAGALAADPRREHRLRTTLAHELGHVRLHNCLWTLDAPATLALNPRCRRATIDRPDGTDWLEWQAGYASGALLMPAGAVARLVGAGLAPRSPLFPGIRLGPPARTPQSPDHLDPEEGPAPVAIAPGSNWDGILVRRVQRAFDVSPAAARVRLLKLGYLAAPVERQAWAGARRGQPAAWGARGAPALRGRR